MGNIAPCKNCADRKVGCHGLCKDYNEWVTQHRKDKEELKASMPHTIYGSDFTGTSPKPGQHRRTRPDNVTVRRWY